MSNNRFDILTPGGKIQWFVYIRGVLCSVTTVFDFGEHGIKRIYHIYNPYSPFKMSAVE